MTNKQTKTTHEQKRNRDKNRCREKRTAHAKNPEIKTETKNLTEV